MSDEHMLLSDAVEYLMKETGKTRRQVKQMLLRALKDGKIRTRGELVITNELTGEEDNQGVQNIPVDFWQGFPSEH